MKYKFDAALPEGFTPARVKDVMEARGCIWAQRIPAGELQLAEEIWLLPGERGAVRFVQDHFVDVPSIRAESDIHGEPARILADLGSDLPLLYAGELSKRANSASPERTYALRALAVIMPDYDGRVVSAYKAALKDPDPAIRMLAMRCISRYPHFVFARELESLAETEPEHKLREEAVQLAKDLRAHGRRGTL